jgi:hypothetical protein
LNGSTTGLLILTRLAQRSLTLQPGNSLISPKLTLSVGFSTSITLRAATQARRLLTLTAAGLPSLTRVTLWITTAIHLDTPTTDSAEKLSCKKFCSKLIAVECAIIVHGDRFAFEIA